MKKLLTMLVATMMLTALLVGCGGGNSIKSLEQFEEEMMEFGTYLQTYATENAMALATNADAMVVITDVATYTAGLSTKDITEMSMTELSEIADTMNGYRDQLDGFIK